MHVLVLSCFLLAGSSFAFVCERTDSAGPSLYWATRHVVMHPYVLSDLPVSQTEFIDALKWAAAQWSETNCSDFIFEIGDPTMQNWVGINWLDPYASVNVVLFRNTWWYPSDQVAHTTLSYLGSTGQIVQADIELNTANANFADCETSDCADAYDLKSVLTHEFGHVLGLDHPDPNRDPQAAGEVMYALSKKGETKKRTLSQQDIDGISKLYPRDAPTGECTGVARRKAGDVTIVASPGCSSQPRSGLGEGWIACLFALILLRRKGRNPLGNFAHSC